MNKQAMIDKLVVNSVDWSKYDYEFPSIREEKVAEVREIITFSVEMFWPLVEASESMGNVWATVCDVVGHDPNHMIQYTELKEELNNLKAET